MLVQTDDSQKEVALLVTTTNQGAASYQNDWMLSKNLRDESTAMVAKNQHTLAKLDKQKAENEASRANSEKALTTNKAAEAAMKQSCDFIIKYFDTRQEANQDEMDSYNQAIDILQGANFGF